MRLRELAVVACALATLAGVTVLVALVTHEGPESAVAEALRLLDGSLFLVQPPLVMHLLDQHGLGGSGPLARLNNATPARLCARPMIISGAPLPSCPMM